MPAAAPWRATCGRWRPAASIIGFQRAICSASVAVRAAGVASSAVDGRGAEFGEARDDVRVRQRRPGARSPSLSSASCGVPFGRVEAVPDAELEVGQPGFGRRRHVGQVRQPLGRGHGIGLDLAAVDLLGGVGGLVAHDVDLAAEQVGHRRAGALVGNGDELGVDRDHEQHAAEMRGRADAGIGVGHLVGVGLHVVDRAPRGRSARSPCGRRSSSAPSVTRPIDSKSLSGS